MAAKPRLDPARFDPNPIRQFQKWFRAAIRAGLPEPNAMTLATSTPDGQVSARMVLLKSVDQDGFVFFTNYLSRKGRELAANPRAALVFYWPALGRQVRVAGRVSKVDPAESDAYFASRPPGSRIASAVSQQSAVIPSHQFLEKKYARLAARHPSGDFPRPIHWGGYCVHPDEIEFWQHGTHRMHDRLRYRKSKSRGKSKNAWKMDRLSP